MKNKEFNIEEFKDLMIESDIQGLNYLFTNEIIYYNRLNERDNYIYNLYLATIALNHCQIDYEESYIPKYFNNDIYYNAKIALLKELDLLEVFYE